MRAALDRHQARDLLLLAACYDQSSAETTKGRWHRLRRKLRYRTVSAQCRSGLRPGWSRRRWPACWLAWQLEMGVGVALGRDRGRLAAVAWRAVKRGGTARAITRNVRVGNRVKRPLRQVLMHFTNRPKSPASPLPTKQRTDDRYELLAKFQGILETLGFGGIVVLVDRVDEPHLINGSVEQMRAMLWPMLDNKFLKHPGIGFKLLLPIELAQFIDREDRDFYQRARLDKQNMIPSFGMDRRGLVRRGRRPLKACAAAGALAGSSPVVRSGHHRPPADGRVPRPARAASPVQVHVPAVRGPLQRVHRRIAVWQISSERFESVLALYSRDQDAFDRGLRAG
jgi:hypothetical protein